MIKSNTGGFLRIQRQNRKILKTVKRILGKDNRNKLDLFTTLFEKYFPINSEDL